MSALIDTNVFIEFLRGKPAAAAFLSSLASKPSTSAINLAELVAGASSQRAEREIESLLADVAILPVSAEIARRAGALKDSTRRATRPAWPTR